MIDVAVITENVIMSDAIKTWSAKVSGVKLATAATTVEDFLRSRTSVPQVVLLDLCRHRRPGVAADVRRLTRRRHRVLALGTRCDPCTAAAVYDAGAHGYICIEQGIAELALAIRLVAAGQFIPPFWAGQAAADSLSVKRPKLSDREQAVLIAYVSGMTLEAAARHVGIRPDTAKTYLRRVKAKYQALGRPARTKVELAHRAWEDGGAVAPRRAG